MEAWMEAADPILLSLNESRPHSKSSYLEYLTEEESLLDYGYMYVCMCML
jgi:hypothetical protein